ncbi:MAG: hypothetical protein IKD72_09245, partial [Clostridia bacterium]|nr:hypothetical protein [Clostridia bacterium]
KNQNIIIESTKKRRRRLRAGMESRGEKETVAKRKKIMYNNISIQRNPEADHAAHHRHRQHQHHHGRL